MTLNLIEIRVSSTGFEIGFQQREIFRTAAKLRQYTPLSRVPKSHNAVRGCKKMGLAPSENRENLGRSVVAKVPVPISHSLLGPAKQ
jgi:hypothetical protein